MTREKFFAMVGSVLICCCVSATAQEKGAWHAVSKTAQSITGDIAFSNEKVTIELSSFIFAQIRALEPGEVSAVFDVDSSTASGRGNLYRLSIPASKKFLHGNTMCGSDETQWMVTYVEDRGHSLRLAFLSGPKEPVFTIDAISSSANLCGTFSYDR